MNTGAQVVPAFGRFDEAGRLWLEFLPPLEVPAGTREVQVQSLMDQYARFVNEAIRKHPEMLFWKRMVTHLNRPLARLGGPASAASA